MFGQILFFLLIFFILFGLYYNNQNLLGRININKIPNIFETNKYKIYNIFDGCSSDNDCAKNEYCKKIDSNKSDCVPKGNIGNDCVIDTDCVSNHCVINKCAGKNGKFIKDMICTHNNQCDEKLVCRNDNGSMKCKELGNEGDDCYSDDHCNNKMWCSLSNKCVLKKNDGEYCFGHDNACISGKCKNMYCMTNKNGSYFISEGSPGCIKDDDCMDGLVCSNMGYKELVCQKKK